MAENRVCFRCFFGTNWTEHRQAIQLCDIPKWIECYRFTHPECVSISVKVWFADSGETPGSRQQNNGESEVPYILDSNLT